MLAGTEAYDGADTACERASVEDNEAAGVVEQVVVVESVNCACNAGNNRPVLPNRCLKSPMVNRNPSTSDTVGSHFK